MAPANRVRQLRSHEGLSRDALAVATGIAPGDLARYESGGAIPDQDVIALAEFFDVSVAYLVPSRQRGEENNNDHNGDGEAIAS
jgi:transcriptional regulator with XRE-family HTH domain